MDHFKLICYSATDSESLISKISGTVADKLEPMCIIEELPDSRPGDVMPVESEAEDVESDLSPCRDDDNIPLSIIGNFLGEELPRNHSCEQPQAIQPDERVWTERQKFTEVPEFTVSEGYDRQEFEDWYTPTDVFLKFLDGSLCEKIVSETNLYAVQQGRVFQQLNDREFLGFVGINFMMGYHILPSWKSYWSSDSDLHVAPISETMSRNRFSEILANLHINNNSEMPADASDQVYKLQPLIDGMNERFALLYHMKRQQSIDESMILCRGRSSLKQCDPMKSVKHGYRLWCRADSTGYVGQFKVYQSSGGNGKAGHAPLKAMGYSLGERVVHDLTQSITGMNCMVYLNDYFSSVPLMEDLKANGILACGSIQQKRSHLPKMKGDKELKKRGDFDFKISNTGIVVFKWQDSKPVNVISNFHGSDATTVTRTQKDGTKQDVPCPIAVADYYENMGCVGKADMLRILYAVDRKSAEWWHRLFWGIIDIAFVNAYVVYKELRGDVPLLEFRRNVSQGLLTLAKPVDLKRGRLVESSQSSEGGCNAPPFTKKRRGPRASVPGDVRFQNLGVHWPEYLETRGRCQVCSLTYVQSRPHSQCSTCKVFLCCNEKKNCFRAYHSQ